MSWERRYTTYFKVTDDNGNPFSSRLWLQIDVQQAQQQQHQHHQQQIRQQQIQQEIQQIQLEIQQSQQTRPVEQLEIEDEPQQQQHQQHQQHQQQQQSELIVPVVSEQVLKLAQQMQSMGFSDLGRNIQALQNNHNSIDRAVAALSEHPVGIVEKPNTVPTITTPTPINDAASELVIKLAKQMQSMGFPDLVVNAEALERNENSIERAVSELTQSASHLRTTSSTSNSAQQIPGWNDPKVLQLRSMGFTDTATVIRVLEECHGNIQRTVETLLRS